MDAFKKELSRQTTVYVPLQKIFIPGYCKCIMDLFCYNSEPEFNEFLKMRHSFFSIRHDIYNETSTKKSLVHDGFLCKDKNPYNLSFIISTDGVPLFKSSHKSVWPIFLVMNELTASVR